MYAGTHPGANASPRLPGSLRDPQRSPSAPASVELPCLLQQLTSPSSAREQQPHPPRRPAAFLRRPDPRCFPSRRAPSPLPARRLIASACCRSPSLAEPTRWRACPGCDQARPRGFVAGSLSWSPVARSADRKSRGPHRASPRSETSADEVSNRDSSRFTSSRPIWRPSRPGPKLPGRQAPAVGVDDAQA
jgi:hypothetical protein